MGTLGNKPVTTFQALEKQSITGNAGTTYALDHAVTNENDLEVFVNNVRQEPTTAYTISGQNIVMSEAIASTDSFYVIYQAQAFSKAVPADTSITTTMLQDDAVTSAKLDTKIQISGPSSDADGTLKVTSNAPTNYPAMVVETSGGGNSTEVHGLYIKNTANGHGLQVHDNSTSGRGITITNNANVAGTYSDLKWQYTLTDQSYGSGIRFKQVNSSHGGQLEFYTDNTVGTYTKQMQITENGHVTMPNQPSFEAWKNNGTVAPGDTMIFNGTDHNIGNMYNSSNGRGTVPVDGRYVVSVFVMNENNAAYVNRYYKIQKNGTSHKHVYNSNPNSTHHHWNFFGILDLNANDYIDIVSDGVAIYANDKKYTTFCMHLLS